MSREQEIMRENYFPDREDCSQVYQRFFHGSQGHSKSKMALDPGDVHQPLSSPSDLSSLPVPLSPLDDIFRSFLPIKENFSPVHLPVSAFLF